MTSDSGEKKRPSGSAWKGTWNRPLKIDEASFDPLTIARMTDHNVRGSDDADEQPPVQEHVREEVRKVIDCREVPNEMGCTLRVAGKEAEVLEAAVMHAIAVHGHEDSPALREAIRKSLRNEKDEKEEDVKGMSPFSSSAA